MWLKAVYATAFIAFEVALVKMSLAASIHDCWNPEKLNRMKFPVSQQEANDPSLGKFSKLLKCMMLNKGDEGLNNMDWSQWQNVAGSGQFPQQNGQQNGQQNWNNQMRNQNPGWIRPGQQQPQPNYGQQGQPGGQGQPQPGGQGQPRPGVHPEDWNNNNRVPPPNGPPPGSNGWPPQQPPRPPPPPNGPPPGWDEQMKNSNNDGNRRKNRRKQQQNNFNSDDMQPGMIPSPDPSMGPGGMMNVPGPNEPQWGSNVAVVEDPEMTKNRQFGYAVMACAVVALAVLMVSAIFCCSSSNSTMSQPATQVSVQPPDTFSIYSYSKQPVVTSDTLRSGPLADDRMDTLRNETLLRDTGASPQYRISDIDPEFARRFREEHY